MQAASRAGTKGVFEAFLMDLSKLPPDKRDFVDLWERDKKTGRIRPRFPEIVKTHRIAPNKVLKRGHSYMLHRSLAPGHATGSPYTPSDITFNPSTTPFAAFMLYSTDARPLYDESDDQFDTQVPATSGTAGIGRRGCLISDTAGPGIFRSAVAYPTTDPFREIEYSFFAASVVPDFATGSITTIVSANHVDGETFTLNDGVNPPSVFEFDDNGSVGAGNVPVDITGAVSADVMRDRIITAINNHALNSQTLFHNATNGGAATVTITDTNGGTIGNQAIGETVADAGFIVSGMSGGGGSALETGDNNVDNFNIECLGMAEGLASGNGEADNRLGIRAVLGLNPTFQGIFDRTYLHEAINYLGAGLGDITSLLHYTGTTTITSDGYVASSGVSDPSGEATEVQIDGTMATDAANQITKSTRQVRLELAQSALTTTAGFRAPDHIRKTLRISSSGSGNDGDLTIKRVIDPHTVEVFEDPVSDESGVFAADLFTTFLGKNAFDGRVANEGRVENSATDGDPDGTIILGEKWVSDSGTGPHVLGRVFSSSKTIKGIRIIFPTGQSKNNCPETFNIDTLDPTANSNNPRPGFGPGTIGDWINQLNETTQADAIFDAGEAGVEYTFPSPVTTQGVRISSMTAFVNTEAVHVAELMVFEEPAAVTFTEGVDDILRLSVDGGSTFKNFSLGTVSGSAGDISAIVDRINSVVRGFQIEAVETDKGQLILRSTVAGDNSTLDIENPAGAANTKLGLPTSPTQATGISQKVVKAPGDALTIVYRINISGDLPTS